MALGERLKRSRLEIGKALAGSEAYRYLSPLTDAQHRIVTPLLGQHACGKVIDLGCGYQPHRRYLPQHVRICHSLDVDPSLPEITYRQDVQNMPAVPSDSYDTALCFEVLEHVPEPEHALREIARILVPGGVLMLSVPHLSRLHNEPADYYRYTRHGLTYLLQKTGFQVHDIIQKGGLGTFLGHQLSTLALSCLWNVPGLWKATWFINRYLLIPAARATDWVLPAWFSAPAGYVVVATKPATNPGPERSILTMSDCQKDAR